MTEYIAAADCRDVRPLRDLDAPSICRSGNKASNLGRMLDAGICVPDGFVVLSGTRMNNPEVRRAVLDRFDALGGGNVAVRSSGLAEDGEDQSYAGHFETFLCVDRGTVLGRIAQVLNAKAKAGAEAEAEENLPMAVVVQPMIVGQHSGVCFSSSPVDDSDDLLLEVVDGLCEQLVSGTETPSRYRVDRRSFELRREHSAVSRASGAELAPHQVLHVARAALHLETLFGLPVDVEWTQRNGTLYILQCRPITARASTTPVAADSKYEYIWSSSEPMWSMEYGLRVRAQLLPLGFRAPVLQRFEDFFYSKIDAVYEHHVSRVDIAEFRPDPTAIVALLDDARDACEAQDLYYDSISGVAFDQMSAGQLLEFFVEAGRFYCRFVGLYTATSALASRPLEDELRRCLSIDELLLLLQPHTPDLMELEHNDWRRLVAVDRFDAAEMLAHVRTYPFLALNLKSIEQVLDTLQRQYEGATNQQQSKLEGGTRRDRIRRDQAHLLRLHPALRNTVELLQRMSLYRMRIKRGWAGIGFFLLPFFEAVAVRAGETAADIQNFYTSSDIERLIVSGVRVDDETKRERALGCLWQVHGGVIEFSQGVAARLAYAERVGESSTAALTGAVASAGGAIGVARIVYCNEPESMREAEERFEEGDILVTEMAQPSMYSLMARSAAVITNEGGLLSHAAIVTRELGIPCVVGTSTATKVLRDGQTIEVRDTGEIVVLDDLARVPQELRSAGSQFA